MRRRVVLVLPVLLSVLVGASPALAWTWPVAGPVVRPFTYRGSPYAGGQHRGIDIGAPPGTVVAAPAAGRVAFAGPVPGGGPTVTVLTPDGYAVTLQHLAALDVRRGDAVVEGQPLAAVGEDGDAVVTAPHVHLGVRDPAGEYVDPALLLGRPMESSPEPLAPTVEPVRPSPAPPTDPPPPLPPAEGPVAVDEPSPPPVLDPLPAPPAELAPAPEGPSTTPVDPPTATPPVAVQPAATAAEPPPPAAAVPTRRRAGGRGAATGAVSPEATVPAVGPRPRSDSGSVERPAAREASHGSRSGPTQPRAAEGSGAGRGPAQAADQPARPAHGRPQSRREAIPARVTTPTRPPDRRSATTIGAPVATLALPGHDGRVAPALRAGVRPLPESDPRRAAASQSAAAASRTRVSDAPHRGGGGASRWQLVLSGALLGAGSLVGATALRRRAGRRHAPRALAAPEPRRDVPGGVDPRLRRRGEGDRRRASIRRGAARAAAVRAERGRR